MRCPGRRRPIAGGGGESPGAGEPRCRPSACGATLTAWPASCFSHSRAGRRPASRRGDPSCPSGARGRLFSGPRNTRGEWHEHGHRYESENRRGTRDTPFRYTAALAERDRAALAGPLGARGHVPRAQPGRAVGSPMPAGEKLYLLDMFPYPSGAGLHVGHPLGYIGTDVLGRYLRMTGHNVLHAMGFDAFGLPAEQYAVQTGTHPRTTTEANIARYRRSCAGWAWPTTSAARSPPPTSSSTAGPSGSSCRSSTPGTTSEQRRARPIEELVGRVRGRHPADPRRAAVGRAVRGRAARRDRRVPAGLRLARRRSTGAPAWARCWPTRRSPPTGAASAATSRCSGAA